MELFLLIAALVCGFYMAWNIGASDVANAIGTAVGSKSLTLRQAVVLAAIMEFCGALIAGDNVSETIMKGIVNTELFENNPRMLVLGMLGSLLAAGSWLQLASYKGWPVSTTHSIIGAVAGFGMVYGGISAIHWSNVSLIFVSWIISPLMGATLAYLGFTFLTHTILYKSHPMEAAKKFTPKIVFVVVNFWFLFLLLEGLHNLDIKLNLWVGIAISLFLSAICAFVSQSIVNRYASRFEPKKLEERIDPMIGEILEKAARQLKKAKEISQHELQFHISLLEEEVDFLSHSVRERSKVEIDRSEYDAVEKIFAWLQIVTAASMAFAHGANDVANAIGPLAAIVNVLRSGAVVLHSAVPFWVLTLGGVGIVIGLATWGWRVVETIGKKITELTPSRGFAAEFGAATTVLIASLLGMPISTTHTLVGAVLGVGLARGIGAINLTTIRDIVISWVVTVPAGALLAIIYFFILKTLLSS